MGEKQDGEASRNEIATGDGVRDVSFDVHIVGYLKMCKYSVFSEKAVSLQEI
jgi:hypothetical protein